MAALLILFSVLGLSCRPKETVVETPVTRIATTEPTQVVTVVVTRERVVQVTEQETVQVVVTSRSGASKPVKCDRQSPASHTPCSSKPTVAS